MLEVLLCVRRCLWRILLQPSHVELLASEPHDLPRGDCHEMLTRPAEGDPECPLQREEEQILCPEVQGSDYDR